MTDRNRVEAVLVQVAVAAFLYYPGKESDELGYTVDEDVDAAMTRIRRFHDPRIDEAAIDDWRTRIARVITAPDADRRAFVADLLALAHD